jgi:hypothetical protein
LTPRCARWPGPGRAVASGRGRGGLVLFGAYSFCESRWRSLTPLAVPNTVGRYEPGPALAVSRCGG